jgi:hypothetical protein
MICSNSVLDQRLVELEVCLLAPAPRFSSLKVHDRRLDTLVTAASKPQTASSDSPRTYHSFGHPQSFKESLLRDLTYLCRHTASTETQDLAVSEPSYDL